MELPNYSRQLLQQLYTLCKEQQFCDCTISIGTIYFRAHKLVLAAASLLFKTLLDNTDTISIDASVVSPEEFALLLEMMYTGKLPVGKHNFSKIISLADSLQMFDVAVSCKNLLTSLVNCSVQGQVVRDVSAPSSETFKKEPEKPQVEILSSESAGEPHSAPEVSATPGGPVKAETEEAVYAVSQEMSVNSPIAQESQRNAETPVETLNTAEVCSPSPAVQTSSEAKETSTEPACERQHDQLNFLLENESIFSEALMVTQDVLKKLEACSEIKGPQKETIVKCLEGGGERSAFQRILGKVREESLDVQTVVSLLRLYQDSNPAVKTALLDRKPEDVDAVQPKGSTEEGKTLSVLLLEHKEDLIQCVTQLKPIMEFLETAKEEFLTGTEKRVILNCCEDRTPKETIENLLHRMTEEKTLTAESLVKLLQAVKMTFPNLGLLLEKLEKLATLPSATVQPSPDDYGTELLRRYHENLSEIFTDNQILLKMISHMTSLAPGEREVMEKLVKRDSGSGGFSSLVSAVLEKQTLSATAVWQLLLVVQETKPCSLDLLMEEIGREPGAGAFFRAVTTPERATLETLLRHNQLISEAIQQKIECRFCTSEEERLAETLKEILSISSETASPEASVRAALGRAVERSVSAIEICHLLCSVHKSFPGLQPVMQELADTGILTKEDGEKETWKVSNKFHLEANHKEDEKAAKPAKEDSRPGEQNDQGETASLPGQQEKEASASPDPAKKSFVCKACDKSFHFYCRLKVHMKRCRVAKSKQVQCKECSETKDSKKELEKHQLEAHGAGGEADIPKKKKKRLPVTCDLCGREFAHASGMQYHKLTEHFDEKPFSCEECGAKFAANSTLKNHLRLHTGDRPFMCKHCLMTFTQASALAYHTKKKHSEGKMYACQYCDAVFAQSIELSRHVRTHTGDKPYVCRDCGKGFRQANGLSIHLHTFHNIEDPYDCKKCRMSFPTLQDHRKHIHEVHSKEYHPCPTCGKIFSAPSMLERHMVTHVGGKPFSCGICNKAYQQLSGLWYHNRTHHPDVFAAQNHRSSKFSSLQCSSCDKTFPNTIEHKKHIKAEHADMKFHECDQCKELFPTPALLQVHVKCQHSGSQPFRCLYCAATFRFPGALQHHVTTEHFKQSESTFPCELCGELFTSQPQLDSHLESEHPKVMSTETQAAASQMVQVIQAPEPVASTEQVITLEETQLAGSQVFVTLPDSQASQASSELVAVTVEDLLDGTVTLICGEAK
ncbi:zinc finger and BTB domain-containing protein 40 isoform X1 [Cebus imitator]|uniref:Zinc finger and BTB domain containing 40 n=1 Tax=Cebus imitator TaxID=2715852 RepID=A0A2K5PSX9_CEBIM|nr:zinc finger and BTB domain-containing protein 40 isoform X1 [Cebus imitator]XP_017389973.1 zinc finger and BTB domain-containing protein 40 isoform X1 [Cebus imitator]XP_017389974.1 zinc finger and BTB domain-containing protein 40 isoform X1 [Cebus imitator]XP_017389975.1 zinc finger and BTB domain-containing protein 40 isoform X1 [Cebus imitator]XP_037596566.1 zinc finger and BTB domain-containing protein 40 isoform X1 [Cebus imitator]